MTMEREKRPNRKAADMPPDTDPPSIDAEAEKPRRSNKSKTIFVLLGSMAALFVTLALDAAT